MAVESRTQTEADNRRGGRGRVVLHSRSLLLVVCLFGSGLFACATSAAQNKAETDIASVRKESNAQTLVERGKAFAAIGDHTRAEEYLASGIDAGADPRDVLPLLIDVCVRTGRYRSAIQHAENHLRKHPHDLRTRVMVGALYLAISEGKQARTQLEFVVGPPPAPAADQTNVATTDADGGLSTTTPSPATLARAGPVDKIHAQAHYLLAIVARDTENDVVEADRHFRAYLRIEPRGDHADEAKDSLLKSVLPEGRLP